MHDFADPRRLIHIAALLSLVFAVPAVGQGETSKVELETQTGELDEEAGKELLQKLNSTDEAVANAAAERLLAEVAEFKEGDRLTSKCFWISDVLRRAPNLKHRKKAFAFLKKHLPSELEGAVRTIEIATPNYPCVGAFRDSIRKTLYETSDDVWLVNIVRRRIPIPPQADGAEAVWMQRRPPTELVLQIDVSYERSEREILECLAPNWEHSMHTWSITQRVNAKQLLEKEAVPVR